MATLVQTVPQIPLLAPQEHEPAFLQPTLEELQALQKFAHLASQHHRSEYSRLKFGPQGCRALYFPLSINAPEHYHHLLSRQFECSWTQSWWFHDPAASVSDLAPTPPAVLGPCGGEDTTTPRNLAADISAAIDEPMVLASPPMISKIELEPSIKTSLTHPINISPLIPPELLSFISSTALRDPSLPTVFDLPLHRTLDRLLFAPPPPHPEPILQTPRSHIISRPLSVADHCKAKSEMSEALQSAINSGIAGRLTPPDSPSLIAIVESASMLHLGDSTISLPESALISEPASSVILDEEASSALPTPPADRSPTLPPSSEPPSFVLGNLLLSSCPGKKVRLQGPVRGRSGVRRDLRTDLLRMKTSGVGCVVCCLDDEELDFLGAPWDEYEQVTKEIGMDVLRLPTPEGLPPSLSPITLDDHLTTLIERYALRGVPVLVHCRGGVGRAGVVACCWALRLGLCGNVLTTPALEMVERVIKVVRRRRSVKAIETFEQVRFLVAYVDHLKERAVSMAKGRQKEEQ